MMIWTRLLLVLAAVSLGGWGSRGSNTCKPVREGRYREGRPVRKARYRESIREGRYMLQTASYFSQNWFLFFFKDGQRKSRTSRDFDKLPLTIYSNEIVVEDKYPDTYRIRWTSHGKRWHSYTAVLWRPSGLSEILRGAIYNPLTGYGVDGYPTAYTVPETVFEFPLNTEIVHGSTVEQFTDTGMPGGKPSDFPGILGTASATWFGPAITPETVLPIAVPVLKDLARTDGTGVWLHKYKSKEVIRMAVYSDLGVIGSAGNPQDGSISNTDTEDIRATHWYEKFGIHHGLAGYINRQDKMMLMEEWILCRPSSMVLGSHERVWYPLHRFAVPGYPLREHKWPISTGSVELDFDYKLLFLQPEEQVLTQAAVGGLTNPDIFIAAPISPTRSYYGYVNDKRYLQAGLPNDRDAELSAVTEKGREEADKIIRDAQRAKSAPVLAHFESSSQMVPDHISVLRSNASRGMSLKLDAA